MSVQSALLVILRLLWYIGCGMVVVLLLAISIFYPEFVSGVKGLDVDGGLINQLGAIEGEKYTVPVFFAAILVVVDSYIMPIRHASLNNVFRFLMVLLMFGAIVYFVIGSGGARILLFGLVFGVLGMIKSLVFIDQSEVLPKKV